MCVFYLHVMGMNGKLWNVVYKLKALASPAEHNKQHYKEVLLNHLQTRRRNQLVQKWNEIILIVQMATIKAVDSLETRYTTCVVCVC